MAEWQRKDRNLYCPTKDMPGVLIGKDFWPSLRWDNMEIRQKHAKRPQNGYQKEGKPC